MHEYKITHARACANKNWVLIENFSFVLKIYLFKTNANMQLNIRLMFIHGAAIMIICSIFLFYIINFFFLLVVKNVMETWL
jgi:hypothetical protein